EHHAGDLEVMDVFRIEHEAERLGIADIGRDRRRDRFGHAGVDNPAAADQQQSRQEYPADDEADRQILAEALAQFDEINVEHHDHEQEQHRDRADVNDHQDHRQEF